ncbi:hypothetical protein AB5N19_05757 [Seiridium cardinale]|uniref:Uncharacterized protein n=1 Tax=Seiridium cardinale TaxID=138064 RepID=A0ABR2XGZ0_9PEZI
MLYSRIVLFLSMAIATIAIPIVEEDGPGTQACKRDTTDKRDADFCSLTPSASAEQQKSSSVMNFVMDESWLGVQSYVLWLGNELLLALGP